ncbi:MAG: metallophosphoesterase family protein [Chitinispirillaceae bacterium]
MSGEKTVIGVVSDTHGLFRPELESLLKGADLIIHAGDVGSTSVFGQLEMIAPVKAVRGNTDRMPPLVDFPETEIVQAGDTLIYLLHDISRLDLDPSAASMDVVVYGHSHKAHIEKKNGVLYFNPGSAGPRRFRTTPSCGVLEIEGKEITPTVYNIG